MNRHNKATAISWILLVITGVLTFLLLRATLPYHDDILYFSVIRFQSYHDFLSYMVSSDSPRLFNIFFPFIIGTIPKWIADMITSAAFIAAIIFTAKTAGIRTDRYVRIAFIVALAELFLPWDYGMTSTIYSTNYIWSLPLAIGFILLFVTPSRKNADRFTTKCLLVILGLCCGWAQEGESLPILIGVGCWLAVNPRRLTSRQLLLVIPMAFSTLSIIIVGLFGRYTRPEVTTNILNQSFPLLIYILITKLNGTLAVTAILLCAILTRSGRVKLWACRKGALPVTLGAMYASCVVGLTLWTMGDHLTWFSQFFAISAGTIILNALFPKPILPSIPATILIIATTATITAHLITAITITRKATAIAKDIADQYLIADSESPFYLTLSPFEIPILAWNKLGVTELTHNQGLWKVFCRHHAKKVKPYPVPVELKDIKLDETHKVAGANPLFSYKGHYVMPDTSHNDDTIALTATFKIGVRQRLIFNLSPFTATDGARWLYAVPDFPNSQTRWIPIIEINQ